MHGSKRISSAARGRTRPPAACPSCTQQQNQILYSALQSSRTLTGILIQHMQHEQSCFAWASDAGRESRRSEVLSTTGSVAQHARRGGSRLERAQQLVGEQHGVLASGADMCVSDQLVLNIRRTLSAHSRWWANSTEREAARSRKASTRPPSSDRSCCTSCGRKNATCAMDTRRTQGGFSAQDCARSTSFWFFDTRVRSVGLHLLH